MFARIGVMRALQAAVPSNSPAAEGLKSPRPACVRHVSEGSSWGTEAGARPMRNLASHHVPPLIADAPFDTLPFERAWFDQGIERLDPFGTRGDQALFLMAQGHTGRGMLHHSPID